MPRVPMGAAIVSNDKAGWLRSLNHRSPPFSKPGHGGHDMDLTAINAVTNTGICSKIEVFEWSVHRP